MSLTTVLHSLTDAGAAAVANKSVMVELGGVVNGVWQPLTGFVGDTSEIICGVYAATDAGGDYGVELVPNDEVLPAGTTYRVTHPGGEQLFFSVPTSAVPLRLPDLLTVDPSNPTSPVLAADVLTKAGNLDGLADPAAARDNLGLGDAATHAAADFAPSTSVPAVYQSAIQTSVDALVAGAPGALDTLNELAAALGDDANFAATVAAEIGQKAAAADLTAETTRAEAAEAALSTTVGSKADASDLAAETTRAETAEAALSLGKADKSALAPVATSGSASDLSTGTLPLAQVPDLSGSYAPLTTPKFLGTTTDIAHFDAMLGSGLLGGFTSRTANADGSDAGIGIVLKQAGDESVAPIQWANNSDNNFLMHLTLTGTASGTASLIGIGVTGTGSGVSGLIVDNRNAGTGGAFANKDTTTSTAIALEVQQSGPGVGFWAWLDTESTAADGTLIKWSGASTANADARILSVQNQLGQEGIYIDAKAGQLHVLNPSALRSEITWDFAGGVGSHFYVDDGTHAAFFSSHIIAASGNILKIMQHQGVSAAKGSETTNEMMRFSNGLTLGFWGIAGASKRTGWGVMTGTAQRATWDTSTVTLATLAQTVKALIDDLNAVTGYGLISA